MHSISLWLLTRIEEKRPLEFPRIVPRLAYLPLYFKELGDWFLTPLRVLGHGRTVRMVHSLKETVSQPLNVKKPPPKIHHVASFHILGKEHVCRTDASLTSQQADWVLTALSIACLIPGLIFGLFFKALSHFSNDVRENFDLIKRHFTPQPLHLGTPEIPVTECGENEAFRKASSRFSKTNNKVDILYVHGNGKLHITAQVDFFKRVNPKKIFLINSQGKARTQPSLEKVIDQIQEWISGALLPYLNQCGKFERKGEALKIYSVNSLKTALAHTPPKRPNGKPYHAIYQVGVSA